MKLLYRLITIIIIFMILIWIPIYAFSNALFYNSFVSEGKTDKIQIDSIPIGRITNVASGDDTIASYQAAWGMVHFYEIDGTYLYTFQLQKPGNGRGNMVFYNHCFYVQQPNGAIVTISTIDESVNYFTREDTLENQEINNAFTSYRTDNNKCYERFGSIWISTNGTEKKVVDGSFVSWLLTSNAFPYTIFILMVFIITANIVLSFGKRKSNKTQRT